MLTVALDDRRPEATLDGLPRRVPLSHGALAALAETCAVPLPWRTGAAGLAAALGDGPAVDTPRSDVTAELVAAGLLDGGDSVPGEVATALTRLVVADVAVDVTVALRRPSGATAQLSAWHRLDGAHVTTLTSSALGAELGWSALGWWPAALSALVDVPDRPGETGGPTPGLCLPLELLLAAGTAVRERRDDLLPLLADRFPGEVTVDGAAVDRRRVLDELGALSRAPLGRLQVCVTGGSGCLGIISWLHFADGWRELVPARTGQAPSVRVEPVAPGALPGRVAGLVARVRP
jgi:hypothetical protein